MKRFDNQLLLHNIKLNGWKALIYCYGLGDARYIEYSAALDSISKLRKTALVLDIGSGHSILPTMLQSKVIILDINHEALKWQVQKSKKIGEGELYAVKASATHLPFKHNIFVYVVSISALEHLPRDLDKKASFEIGRVLKEGGSALITLPGYVGGEKIRANRFVGVPLIYQKLFGKFLPSIFKKLNVDRGESYYERRYTPEDAIERIIKPSRCKGYKIAGIKSKLGRLGTLIINGLHRNVIPFSAITLLEYLFAKNHKIFEIDSKDILCGLILVKMRKGR